MAQHKKRVLFLGPFPPPHYGSSILCERFLDFFKESKRLTVKHIKLNYSREMHDVGTITWSKLAGFFTVRRKICESIKTFKPDFAYVAPATTGYGLVRDALFVRLLKRHNIPILFHIHSRITPEIRNQSMNNRLLHNMLVNETAIVLGEELVSDVSWVLPRKQIIVLPNAIDNTVSNSMLQQLIKQRRKQKKVTLLFLSNMIRSKGWPEVLAACSILHRKGYTFSCQFVGAWPSSAEEAAFTSYVTSNNLHDVVVYRGKKTGARRDALIASSDIFIFPTTYELETFGLVITEAMMYGLPVIAHGVATIPSIVSHAKTGFILTKNTPEEIAQYCERLMEDSALRQTMGLRGRERFLKHFEMHAYQKRLTNILTSFKRPT